MLSRRSPADGVLQLHLERPGRLNALTLELVRELLQAVHHAHEEPGVRVILLSGEGRAFCAGKDKDDPPTPEFVDALQHLARVLMDSRKPVVAAVQGWAVGAGFEMLMNCDIVVAADDARFMLPETNIGLFGTGGVVALLPRVVGLARAKGLLMLGREISAQQAGDWGLVWQVVPRAELEGAALDVAKQLAGADPRLLSQLKSLLHEEAVGDLASILKREAQAHVALNSKR
ncbi:enoyl-CoA hydratase/isomerase family protein [Ramlibacter albus]|uniref:Enoyl-CoA hydratase/isomerase family protein n=1 Tax=Ramlibacter albus TaxID=2079448 RepID=A0A923M6B1_9BURK|nr:enoyl-CoA hydratase/isomerase family protein [Ramlibacter albus]